MASAMIFANGVDHVRRGNFGGSAAVTGPVVEDHLGWVFTGAGTLKRKAS